MSDAASPMPRLQVFNWQVGIREAASTSGRVTNVDDLVEARSLVYMSPESLSDSRKVTEASERFSEPDALATIRREPRMVVIES